MLGTSTKALRTAFDASRVGGKKRSYYAILDGHAGLAAWGPPLMLRDSGYRSVTEEPAPEEQQRLDGRASATKTVFAWLTGLGICAARWRAKTASFSQSLRGRELALKQDPMPVGEKNQRLPSKEQVVALEQTLQRWGVRLGFLVM